MRPNSNNYRQYRKNAAGNPILPDGEPLFRVGLEGFKDTIYGLIQMVYCLDPEARVTYSRVIDTEVALGMPKIKAVQALSELLRDDELREEVRQDEMAVYIRMGTEARP